MRTAKQIQDDIDTLKELLSGDLSQEEKKDFTETLEQLEQELQSVESVKEEEPKAAKQTKTDSAANEKIKEITEEISDIQSLLEGELSEQERKDFEETLEDLRQELKDVTEKTSQKAQETESKVVESGVEDSQKKRGRGRPKKSGTAPKPKKERAAKPVQRTKKFFKAPSKSTPKQGEKKEKREVIVVGGIEYDIAGCKGALQAYYARKKQKAKSDKKYKTKKPAAKAASQVEHFFDQIDHAIPTKKAESNPKQIIATFKEFKKKMNEAFNVLARIINKQDVALLKKSLLEIDEIIEKYK